MMRTEEFPRGRWEDYLSELTREAKDHPVRVRVESQTLGDQVLVDGLHLVAISLEAKGTAKGGIEIITEQPDGTHLTHLIPDPERIYLAREESKEDVYLDIEDRDGAKTLVFLHQGKC